MKHGLTREKSGSVQGENTGSKDNEYGRGQRLESDH